MRSAEINKRKIYYALYSGKAAILEGGKNTGRNQLIYGKPVALWINVSGATAGLIEQLGFGTHARFDKALVTTDKTLPIAQDSRFWVDTMPVLDEEGATSTPHDMVMAEPPRETLNQAVYLLERVKISASGD